MSRKIDASISHYHFTLRKGMIPSVCDNVQLVKHTYFPSGLTLASKLLRFLHAPMLSGNLAMPASFKTNIYYQMFNSQIRIAKSSKQ